MTNLTVLLEQSPQGHYVFFPGNNVQGVVELSLNEVKKFRGCYVLIYGYARAHWTESRSTGSGKNRRTHTVHYEGKEVFINSKTYLFGFHGGPTIDVQPGVHRYNFACQLPDLVPSTMDGSYGKIEYYVEAVLDIPWRFDKEVKVPFTVVRVDNLNFYPELRMAQKMEEHKTFCCLFCESGPLFMTVSVPHSGFAKGEKIPIHVQYVNRSNVNINRTKVQLKRLISFTSHTPSTKTRVDREAMVEILGNGVGENATVDYNFTLDIPSIMMNTNSRFCQVVRVDYYVKVEGLVDDCHTNPEVKIPVTIYSIGFQENHPQPTAPVPASGYMPSAPPTTSHMPSAPIAIDEEKNDLPPSFDEAINMAKPFTTQTEGIGWNVTKQ